MKKLTFIFSLITLLIINSSSSKAFAVNIHQFKSAENQTREVSDFHAIASGGSFNIVVTMGTKESLEIDADESDLERIETLVQNGTLRIRLKRDAKNYNIPFKRKVNIYITAKKLDALALSGSGNLEVKGALNSASVNIQVSGSGSVTTVVDTQSISLAVSGSGNVNISGVTGSANIAVSGSGGVNAKNLKTKNSNIKIAGSGNVTVFAEETLNVNLAGSGSVKYLGSPELQINKIGSGSVSKLK